MSEDTTRGADTDIVWRDDADGSLVESYRDMVKRGCNIQLGPLGILLSDPEDKTADPRGVLIPWHQIAWISSGAVEMKSLVFGAEKRMGGHVGEKFSPPT